MPASLYLRWMRRLQLFLAARPVPPPTGRASKASF